MTHPTNLKICGVCHEDDLLACCEVGVSAVGFNFWPGSPRHVSVARAERLVALARAQPSPPFIVGVFVHVDDTELHAIQTAFALDFVQVHDHVPVRAPAPYVAVIRGTPPLLTMPAFDSPPAWILLDAITPGFGGEGRTTDWAYAANAVQLFAPTPVWLAGGLTEHNAAQAIAQVHPAGLDVASGAESSPGRKDPRKLAALARACGLL